MEAQKGFIELAVSGREGGGSGKSGKQPERGGEWETASGESTPQFILIG